jgi:hypothetical protein
MVEIHIRLQNTREIYQQNLKEVCRDAVPVETQSIASLRLVLSDMLIHACLHLDKHFVTSHVQFTSFNDIVNLVREVESQKSKVESQKTEDKRQENQEPRIKTEEIEDFWERFEAKCIKYNFADTVFRYLVMVRHYYGAPLPDYLYEKYGPLTPEGGKDFIRFENFLAGTGNAFIGRGAPTSGTATHLLHLKALKNPVDFMRSRSNGMSTLSADRQVRYHTHREVVFPGKEFMVEKYGLKSKVEGQKSEEDGQGSEVEGNKIKESKVKGQKTFKSSNHSNFQIFKPFKLSNFASGGCGIRIGGIVG